MASETTKKRIELGRDFIRFDMTEEGEPSDQQQGLKQPPLTKEKTQTETIQLPRDFSRIIKSNQLYECMIHRESHRVYTDEKVNLTELAFLLYMTQGVKSIRGNHYATLRVVPSGGARHAFESYVVVRKVEGLKEGIYHYLPLSHELEHVASLPDMTSLMNDALLGQKWALKANLIFFWSVVPYRAEWRYSFMAHRILLVDIGYVSQNLYLASEALGLGTCAIGAFDRSICDQLLQLDGQEEFTILASPVGTVSKRNKQDEDAFYAFLKQADHDKSE